MKSTVVDESLSSFKTNVLFQRIPTFYRVTNLGGQPNSDMIFQRQKFPEQKHIEARYIYNTFKALGKSSK